MDLNLRPFVCHVCLHRFSAYGRVIYELCKELPIHTRNCEFNAKICVKIVSVCKCDVIMFILNLEKPEKVTVLLASSKELSSIDTVNILLNKYPVLTSLSDDE